VQYKKGDAVVVARWPIGTGRCNVEADVPDGPRFVSQPRSAAAPTITASPRCLVLPRQLLQIFHANNT